MAGEGDLSLLSPPLLFVNFCGRCEHLGCLRCLLSVVCCVMSCHVTRGIGYHGVLSCLVSYCTMYCTVLVSSCRLVSYCAALWCGMPRCVCCLTLSRTILSCGVMLSHLVLSSMSCGAMSHLVSYGVMRCAVVLSRVTLLCTAVCGVVSSCFTLAVVCAALE